MNSPMDDRAAVPTDPGSDALLGFKGAIAELVLPAIMTSRYATDLAGELQTMRGRPIALDASAVQQIGTLCLQVLISARQTWRADGQGFSLTRASDVMARRWEMFGMPPGEIVEFGA